MIIGKYLLTIYTGNFSKKLNPLLKDLSLLLQVLTSFGAKARFVRENRVITNLGTYLLGHFSIRVDSTEAIGNTEIHFLVYTYLGVIEICVK